MRIVVDASVAIKWALPEKPNEQDVDRAFELLEGIATGAIEAFQPPHWIGEVLSVIARLDRSRVDRTVQLLMRMPKRILESEANYVRAAQIAADCNQHLFDTLYHAVALETGAVFVTADERYFSKVVYLGSIQRLPDLQL